MKHYIGLIQKDVETDYGVSFPDFPGLVTASASLDEARAMAEEAVAFHIGGLAENNVSIPEPSDVDAIVSDLENCDGIPILVRFNPDSFNTLA